MTPILPGSAGPCRAIFRRTPPSSGPAWRAPDDGTVTRPRRRGPTTGPVLPSLLITGLLMAGIVALSPGDDMRTLRRIFGVGDERLGQAPGFRSGEGSYEFALTQRGGNEPVGYDPCRVIEVEINPEGAPDSYRHLVDTAIEHTSEATGLVFEVVGETDRRDFGMEGSFGRDPVLVAWATEDEVPKLEGDVAGLGGSAAASVGAGRLGYLTGIVVLDADAYADMPDDDGPFAQAIIDHEFGHLVGLAHVDDSGELMYADNVGVTRYGPGDLEGLARIGSISC